MKLVLKNQIQQLQRRVTELDAELTELKEIKKLVDQGDGSQQITAHYENLLQEKDAQIRERDSKITEKDEIIHNLNKDLALATEKDQASKIIQDQLNEQLKIQEKRLSELTQ